MKIIDIALMFPNGMAIVIEVECDSYELVLEWVEKNKHLDGVDKTTRRKGRFYGPFAICGDHSTTGLVPVRASILTPSQVRN